MRGEADEPCYTKEKVRLGWATKADSLRAWFNTQPMNDDHEEDEQYRHNCEVFHDGDEMQTNGGGRCDINMQSSKGFGGRCLYKTIM